MLSYSPSGLTEALDAMTRLLYRSEWRHSDRAPDLRTRLTTHLDAPERHLRFLAVLSLPAVHTDPTALASALSARIDAEDDTDVLTAALSELDRTVPPELADPILATAANVRTAGPSITELVINNDAAELRDLLHVWVTAHLNCALQAATPYAKSVVNAWFSDPAVAGSLFRAAVASLRDAFSFRADDTIRDKAFALIRTAAAALKVGLIATPSDASVVLAADALAQQLYFASGAYDGNKDKPRPTANQKAQWFTKVIGTLEDLTTVRHPHSCYRLLETLEFFIDENPLRVFHAVAATIKDDSSFQFESMGAEAVVLIIDRYLAEHRQLFLTQPHALAELRRVLEVFAAAGWPAALHLSYSLGDVFR